MLSALAMLEDVVCQPIPLTPAGVARQERAVIHTSGFDS